MKVTVSATQRARIYSASLSAREAALLVSWERSRRVLVSMADIRKAVGGRTEPDWQYPLGVAGVYHSGMDADDETAAERAARRAKRAGMVYGKASSFAEMEAANIAFWRGGSQGDKLAATLELVIDSWYVAGNEGPPPGLDRTVYGVRKLID